MLLYLCNAHRSVEIANIGQLLLTLLKNMALVKSLLFLYFFEESCGPYYSVVIFLSFLHLGLSSLHSLLDFLHILKYLLLLPRFLLLFFLLLFFQLLFYFLLVPLLLSFYPLLYQSLLVPDFLMELSVLLDDLYGVYRRRL